MSELPSGTVTFLFSDIEGSTRLMRKLGEGWAEAISAHNHILREAFAGADGREVDRQGDAFFAVFPTARAALTAASAAQRELSRHDWPDGADVRVRMGIHTGEPAVGGEGYLGIDVVRAARICSAAHGGQVLVSETTRALVGTAELEDVGLHRLKDMDDPERLFQLVLPEAPVHFAAPRTAEPAVTAPTELARRLEGLGPAIERQVADALARSNVPPARRREVEQTLSALNRSGVRLDSALKLAGFVLLMVVAGLVLIVYLVVRAF